MVSAHAYFRIANIEEDCDYPKKPTEINWLYMGPIMFACVLSILNLILLLTRKRDQIQNLNILHINQQNSNQEYNQDNNAAVL